MSRSLNRLLLIGHVGQDPELRKAGENDVAHFSLATSRQWVNAKGDKQERTEWHRCVVWGKLATNVVDKYVRKGDKLYVEGRVEYREWTDDSGKRNGTDVVVDELILLGSPAKTEGERRPGGRSDEDADDYEPPRGERERERGGSGRGGSSGSRERPRSSGRGSGGR